jgi:hypothetical protein
MEAGRRTVERLLSDWQTLDDTEDDEETLAELKTLTGEERALLERFLKALAANQEQDPKLSATLPDEPVGIYAGAGRSGLMQGGAFQRLPRDTLKAQVRDGEIRLLIGTDAASEGLNLQRLGTLINVDLPCPDSAALAAARRRPPALLQRPAPRSPTRLRSAPPDGWRMWGCGRWRSTSPTACIRGAGF